MRQEASDISAADGQRSLKPPANDQRAVKRDTAGNIIVVTWSS